MHHDFDLARVTNAAMALIEGARMRQGGHSGRTSMN